jgi:hypothetical protein
MIPLLLLRGFWKVPPSNFLTATRSQIIVEVSVVMTMRIPGITTRWGNFALWQVLTCLLLAALFFYNPFLAAVRSSNGLAVGHPASHRASVGSSELEQFAPPIGSAIALLPNIAEVRALLPQVTAKNSLSRYKVDEEFVVTPRTGFSSSLWFRPPPVA